MITGITVWYEGFHMSNSRIGGPIFSLIFQLGHEHGEIFVEEDVQEYQEESQDPLHS